MSEHRGKGTTLERLYWKIRIALEFVKLSLWILWMLFLGSLRNLL